MLKIAECPVETTMSLIGGKWKVLIIKVLSGGKKRFGELKNGVTGISAKVLTAQLNEMMQDKLVVKMVYAQVPPKTEYELTEVGRSLMPIIIAMKDWGSKYTKETLQARGADECEAAEA